MRLPTRTFLLCLLATSAAAQSSSHPAPPAARASASPPPPRVWIVDGSGPADFTQIQPAIDAASDGDFILVRTGSYAPCTLDGRSLGIAADMGATVQIVGGAAVRNLPAGRRVLLLGLGLSANPALPGGAVQGLVAENDVGSLHLERCQVRGYDTVGSDGTHALLLQNCADAVLESCTLHGGVPQTSGTYGKKGGNGLTAVNSTLALWNSSSVGAAATPGYLVGGTGGQGARLDGGSAFAAATMFQAGAGGSNDDCFFGTGGDAGQPLQLVNIPPGGTLLDALASSVLGALGGSHPCGSPGNDSYPLGTPGAFATLSGAARTLACSLDPVREGQTLAVTLTGEPGDTAFLVVSTQAQHAYHANLHGVQVAAAPFLTQLGMGSIPAGGSVSVNLPVPLATVPYRSATVWYLQGVTLSASGEVFLSNPIDLLVLDSSL